MREFQVMKQELQEMVHQRLDMSTELSDEAIGDVIDEVIMEKSRNMYMSSVTKLTLRQELFNAIRRLDLLQELIDDKSVSEIMVNGADSIFYERNGKIYTWDRHFESREKLEDVIQQIVSRVITIEDSAELQLHDIANLVRMEVRQADAEGVSSVTLRDLIKASLRMRPDRIIVGEVRGPEALDMIQSMNTGHDGSLSTGHANSPEDMLSRIETMILMGSDMPLPAIRKQIASSIDIIIQLGRLRDRSRRVTEITEVLSCDQNGYVLNKLFQFNERDDLLRETSVYGNAPEKVRGGLDRTGYRLMNRRKLRAAALESPEI